MTPALRDAPFRAYGPEFDRDPQAVYAAMREKHGPIAPVEIVPGVHAYLVIGYWAARDLLLDTDTWSKDSRGWERHQELPKDHQVLGMLSWRPNPLFNDHAQHRRYRTVVSDCLGRLDPFLLRTYTSDLCDALIERFLATGSADLVAEYARLVPGHLFNRLFGLPDSEAARLTDGIAGLMEAQERAAEATASVEAYLSDLYALKTNRRGDDLTSWIMDHPVGLSAEEVLHHLVLTCAAAFEPTTNLISNALSRMLSDDRYYATWADGALSPREAISEVLRTEPPMANYAAHYPRWDVAFHGTNIRADSLVLVSFAATNTDPEGPAVARADGGAHLAWSAGPHACPAKQPATLIAMTAIEQLATRCTGLELAVPRAELPWRPGLFHRALAQLPVTFTPQSTQSGAIEWNAPTRSIRPDGTSTAKPHAFATTATPPGSNSPVAYPPGSSPGTRR